MDLLAKKALLGDELQHALAVEYDDGKDQLRHLDHGNILNPSDSIDICVGLVVIEERSRTYPCSGSFHHRRIPQYIESIPFPNGIMTSPELSCVPLL